MDSLDIVLEPGRYVVAVSGGVDSIVLLDLLAGQRQSPVTSHQSPGTGNGQQTTKDSAQFIIAHFDHGIRQDSAADRQLVQALAEGYGLPFVFETAQLGAHASEATARRARYDFLERVRREHGAQAIITAHHQDDVLETAILNILRGTGRKGLTALGNRPGIVRPLLNIAKQDIRDYARRRELQWHEDSTNRDETYRRNYVRRRILPRFAAADREKLLAIIATARSINHELDQLLVNGLHTQPAIGQLDRRWFIGLPHAVAREYMAAWLRQNGIADFDTKTLERLVTAAKTGRSGSRADVSRRAVMDIGGEHLALRMHER